MESKKYNFLNKLIMKIIFMGNPEFAIPTLSKLIDSKHEIVAVVSNCRKNIGRNNKKSFTPVGNYANEKKNTADYSQFIKKFGF